MCKVCQFTFSLPSSVFDKLIWHTICPKELLIWHCTVLSLGQMAQLYTVHIGYTPTCTRRDLYYLDPEEC